MALKKTISLHKARILLKSVYSWYRKKGKSLPLSELDGLEKTMLNMDQAILKKDRTTASSLAEQLSDFADRHCKRSIFHYVKELVFALIFALVIATIVRQMWFEPYEIPTGSMRPTFREQDHLTVTKTAFGINYPLKTKHLYFDPDLVQRGSVFIFSGDKMALSDVDTTYFGIFPYKKRFIKRCIAKPGDSIYFYGGRLYGVDKEGHDLTELRDTPWMENLEYVPFLSFEGTPTLSAPHTLLLRQMHQTCGKMLFSPSGTVQGEVQNGKRWVKDNPTAQTKVHSSIETYSDFFGMRNYAEARLLSQEQFEAQYPNQKESLKGELYLQLDHTPSLTYPKPVVVGNYIIMGYTTVIPIQQSHLDKIMEAMYTARFVVANGKARRYSLDHDEPSSGNPSLPNVPDGTYEFYFGKASTIHWGGISTSVSPTSPLYKHSAKNVQFLFNMGIDMDSSVNPSTNHHTRYPHRYAYFRNGDLYLMGAPIITKEDSTLVAFNEAEMKRQEASTTQEPYVAFKDYGPPMKDGHIDVDFIKTFGVTVPPENYLALGDNHAMSADSRVFGFVPQDNVQGAPYWIVWPPGDRLGPPAQQPYPFMNIPRAIVWGIGCFVLLCWYIYHRWSIKRPIVKKLR